MANPAISDVRESDEGAVVPRSGAVMSSERSRPTGYANRTSKMIIDPEHEKKIWPTLDPSAESLE